MIDIEQRAHEIALEVMKMHFEINRSIYEGTAPDSDGERNVSTEKLTNIYSVAYHLVIENEIKKK